MAREGAGWSLRQRTCVTMGNCPARTSTPLDVRTIESAVANIGNGARQSGAQEPPPASARPVHIVECCWSRMNVRTPPSAVGAAAISEPKESCFRP